MIPLDPDMDAPAPINRLLIGWYKAEERKKCQFAEAAWVMGWEGSGGGGGGGGALLLLCGWSV